ncbi:FAD:protein FMN transferase [Larkinella punicea]|uniref:FAD:protein FMN transferase n=1 Tax=Larkinella punicea TaxID=2315727 RepID=A0A368JT11_9BACT|nr:FAD:protein FMN transferase [Larkinella punicea]RCR70787.1 FAD:protein FMN transferase [Larkinella punicea]
MNLFLRTLRYWSLCWGIVACQPARQPYTTLEGQAQGTTFRIVYAGEGKADFTKPVDSLFRLIDRSMSLWDSTSLISRINRNEPNLRVDGHFTTVYERARQIAEQTGGAFDVTVGPLVNAWGFSYKKGQPPPGPRLIDSLRQGVGYRKMHLLNGVLKKDHPNMALDFNALAQGYTVDLVAGFLEKYRVANYLVEIGGEVRAKGTNPTGEPWQVGIDKPVEDDTHERILQTVVPLSGRSLATSGSYRKFVVRNGKKFSHAIDPRTGYPITHQLLSVSVIADDCMTADAYATAFLVMGLEKAVPIARAQGMELFGISYGAGGKLTVVATEGFGK